MPTTIIDDVSTATGAPADAFAGQDDMRFKFVVSHPDVSRLTFYTRPSGSSDSFQPEPVSRAASETFVANLAGLEVYARWNDMPIKGVSRPVGVLRASLTLLD